MAGRRSRSRLRHRSTPYPFDFSGLSDAELVEIVEHVPDNEEVYLGSDAHFEHLFARQRAAEKELKKRRARPNPRRARRNTGYVAAKIRANTARRNSPPEFTVYHADHGIDPRQMAYIQKMLARKAPQGFFIQQFALPKRLGNVPNAMYGPSSGDPPVPESQVHYADRAGRGWEDRMIDRPPRPVHYGQAIGVREGDSFTLFTVYGGPLAPQNPKDPGNQDPEASILFWKKHALSSHQW